MPALCLRVRVFVIGVRVENVGARCVLHRLSAQLT